MLDFKVKPLIQNTSHSIYVYLRGKITENSLYKQGYR